MPSPIILVHTEFKVPSASFLPALNSKKESLLSQRSINATLCSYGVTPRREQFGYACSIEACLGQTKSSSQTGATSAHNKSVIFMVLRKPGLVIRFGAHGKDVHTIIGYLLLINGDASLARSG